MKTPITDSCVKSADLYGALDVIPASVARRIETMLQEWAEAADASQQPQAFYDGYSETQMRAMQAMLTNANREVSYLKEDLQLLKGFLRNAANALDNAGNEFAAKRAYDAANAI